jgi:hypothetical protein
MRIKRLIIILDKVGLSAEDRFEYSKIKFHSYPDQFYYTNSYFVQLTMTFSLATLLLSTGGRGERGGGGSILCFTAECRYFGHKIVMCALK